MAEWPEMTAEDIDRMLRANHAATGVPTFYGAEILKAAKREGVDVEGLLRDGVIAPYAKIPRQ